MNLLITNDDGIDSVFLHELVRALRAAAHAIHVVAPKTEQSWISKAMSRSRPVHAERNDGRIPGFDGPTWIVDGTPSDCVNIALHHLLPDKPDGVVSGPNIGCNAGLPFILGSGTIAGAIEATFHGFPAAAISQDLTVEAFDAIKSAHGRPGDAVLATLRISCRRAAQLLPELLGSGIGVQSSGSDQAQGSGPSTFDPRPSTVVHNLNFPFPCTLQTEVKRTVPARVLIGSLFAPAQADGSHHFRFGFGEEIPPPPPAAGLPPPLSDQVCLAQGCISHTVLDYGRLGHPGRTP